MLTASEAKSLTWTPNANVRERVKRKIRKAAWKNNNSAVVDIDDEEEDAAEEIAAELEDDGFDCIVQENEFRFTKEVLIKW